MLKYHAAYYAIEDGWYLAEVLDFPGVVTQGKNLKEARRMLQSALQDMVEWRLTEGEALPRPKKKVTDKKAELVEPLHLSLQVRAGATA
jgi:predicted RNase H-like HicB family nuclease